MSRRVPKPAAADALGATLVAYVALSVPFGGASHEPSSARVVLEALAVPLLAWAVALGRAEGETTTFGARLTIAAGLAFAALAAIQLAPLPPTVWSALPGRAAWLEGLPAAIREVWRPASLDPAATRGALVSMAAPAFVWLAASRVGPVWRRRAILTLVICAALSLPTAVIQAATGTLATTPTPFAPDGSKLFAAFFPNQNHWAALLAVSAPLAWGLIAENGRLAPGARIALAALVFVAGATGAGASGSRAGLALFALVSTACAIVWGVDRARETVRARSGGARPGAPRAAMITAVAALAVLAGTLAGAAFGGRALDRLAAGGATDPGRVEIWAGARDAALAHAPIGSGAGTFASTFPRWERLGGVHVMPIRHAHMEPLEIAAETGLPGLAALLALLLAAGSGVARRRRAGGALAAAAAPIALGALALHSLVDYPLRTHALMVAAALALAATVAAPGTGRDMRRRALVEPAVPNG